MNHLHFSWRTDDTQCNQPKLGIHTNPPRTMITLSLQVQQKHHYLCVLKYNHQEITENVAEKFLSLWRPVMRAECGAVACVRLLSGGLQSLNGDRRQAWERGGRCRENQGGQNLARNLCNLDHMRLKHVWIQWAANKKAETKKKKEVYLSVKSKFQQ